MIRVLCNAVYLYSKNYNCKNRSLFHNSSIANARINRFCFKCSCYACEVIDDNYNQ